MFLNFSESNRLTFESFTFLISICFLSCSLVAQLVKSLPVMQDIICNAGDLGLIPGSGRSSGEGNGYQLQYSCLENSMDGIAWWPTVHRVAKSQTWLKRLSMHTHIWAHTEYFCFSFKMSPYFFWNISLHFCSLLILSYRIFHANENVLYLYYSIK